MLNVLSIPAKHLSDTWLITTWEDFLVASGNAETDKIRGYYDSGLIRIEIHNGELGQSPNPSLSSLIGAGNEHY